MNRRRMVIVTARHYWALLIWGASIGTQRLVGDLDNLILSVATGLVAVGAAVWVIWTLIIDPRGVTASPPLAGSARLSADVQRGTQATTPEDQ